MNDVAVEFAHPEDQAALRNLEAIPLFHQCVKAFLNVRIERMMHGINMAQKIRLSPRQLPRIYRFLPRACGVLGIAEPEFYLEMNPSPNAYAMGDTQTSITVTSGLLESMDDAEIETVVGHECGHIACRHMLYHTMAQYLIRWGGQLFGPLAMLTTPVQLALLYWNRRSELSADRAAAIVMGGPESVVQTMIRLSGGPKSITGDIDVELYQQQAEAYDKLHESAWDTYLQGLAVMGDEHPFLAVRTREILRWTKTEEFARITAALDSRNADTTRCRTCGHTIAADWKFCRRCGGAADAEVSGRKK